MDRACARAEAERRFGDRRRYLAECRQIHRRASRSLRGAASGSELSVDLRWAWRSLRRSPGYVLVAAATLGLALGAATLVWSIVDAVLLRPLEVAHPERTYVLLQHHRAHGSLEHVSPANFVDWRHQTRSVEAMAALDWSEPTLTGVDEPARILAAEVSEDFFRVHGVEPARGRVFHSEELLPDGPEVVIVGQGFWRLRLGSDHEVIGRQLELDGVPHTIVGVLPERFEQPAGAQVWLPLRFDFDLAGSRGAQYLEVLALRRAEVTEEQARAELERIGRALEEEYPHQNADSGIALVPLHEATVGQVRPALILLLGAVLLVLLIATANLANLTLARSGARQRELAIRASVGAGRSRLTRQLFLESLLVAVLGGALGLGLAQLSLHAVTERLPAQMPRIETVAVDARVALFAGLASLLSALLYGLLPSLRSAISEPADVLRGGAALEASPRHPLRRAFLVAEIALAVVVAIGALLLVRSFERLLAVDPGFSTDGVLTAAIRLPEAHYPEEHQQAQLFEELVASLEQEPAVAAAGLVPWLPLDGWGWSFSFQVVGRPEPEPGREPIATLRFVDDGYFRTLAIPLQAGREFASSDRAGSEPVVIVNQTFARRYLNDEQGVDQSLDQRIVIGYGNPDGERIERRVVGVVGDVRQWRLDRDPLAAIYVPHTQLPFDSMTVVVRGQGDPMALLPLVREHVRRLDPRLALERVRPLETVLERARASARFVLEMLLFFAGFALLLAASGLYGVFSQVVLQQRRELGVRVALGAGRADILRWVLDWGLATTLPGIALGLGGALLAGRLVTSLLYQVEPTDPLTYLAVSLLLLVVAALACLVPARRALAVDPVSVLRTD